jgi:hypothetical protein
MCLICGIFGIAALLAESQDFSDLRDSLVGTSNSIGSERVY